MRVCLAALVLAIVWLGPRAGFAANDGVDLRIELCRNATIPELERVAPKYLFWTKWQNIVQLCPLYSSDWRWSGGY